MIQFDEVLVYRLDKTKETLSAKAEQYQRNGNRYWNFDKAADFMGITPEQALWGFVMKHITALGDFVDMGGETSMEQWEEKIGDIICYLILLEGIVKREACKVEIGRDVCK